MKITKEIAIGDLFKTFKVNENGDYIIPPSLKIETPDGFKKVVAGIKTQPNPEYEIETIEGTKACFTDFHKIEVIENEDLIDTNRKWKNVKNLTNDKIVTKNGIEHISKVYFNGKYSNMYDLQVTENKCYYTNGIVSHNTNFLGNIAINVFEQGKKVLVYSFETSTTRLLARYYANLIGMSTREIIADPEKAKKDIKEKLSSMEGDIIIKEYGANTTSSNDLCANINDLIMYKKWKPDLVIIDYILIMKTNDPRLSVEDKYMYFKKVTEEMRNIAKLYKIPIVTASQLNRNSMDERGGSKPLTTSKDVSESRGILDTVDYFITINQTARDKTRGDIMLYIDANRNGESGNKIYFNVDYEHMRVREKTGGE